MMKNRFLYIFLSALLCVSACKQKPSVIELPIETESISGTTGINEAENISSIENLTEITWGYGHLMGDRPMLLQSDCEIATVLDTEFNVRINPVIVQNFVINKNKLPDFFMSLEDKVHELFDEGLIRSIPHDMVRQYAPRYSNILDREPYGWDIATLPMQDSFYCLFLYNELYNQPMYYSVYRLDWLEELSIIPNGKLSNLDDGGRFYFTDIAFTQDQFVSIIRAFANKSEESGGLLVPARQENLFLFLSSIASMHGLIPGIINNSGCAVPYYASEQYKDFMIFLSDLQKEGLLLVAAHADFHNPPELLSGLIGWNTNTPHLLMNYNTILPGYNLFLKDSDAKLLVTPPEVGSTGIQGFYAPYSSFNPDWQWVVSASVTDEKLIKILQIFDALSCDPEFYLLSKYGEEGVDFMWFGEPYNSRIIRTVTDWRQAYLKGILAFNTTMEDGYAGKFVYTLGNNALTDFATNPATSRMAIRPYKLDMFGYYSKQRIELDAAYERWLRQIRQNFYFEVITGRISNVEEKWDDYINDLHANGLSEYIALYEQYD